jgi:hypothetical protein
MARASSCRCDLSNCTRSARRRLQFDSAQGCFHYPPAAFFAEVLGPFDSALSRLGQFDAAFMAVKASKR